MRAIRIPLAALLVFAVGGTGFARPTGPAPPLTPPEDAAVARCLDVIRGCQLSDGAFGQVAPSPAPTSPVWVAPYFVNYAAVALLAGHERRRSPADLDRVRRWLEWCAKNQSTDGFWYDFTGTAAGYQSNGKVDAWDSSAAMFLLAAAQYQKAGGKPTPAVAAAAVKALACIGAVRDADGLTWATPAYKVKYLMDNIEVYAGLAAGAELFAAVGRPDEAKQSRGWAAGLADQLPSYWVPADKAYAFALHPNGSYEGGVKDVYPHGLAQLFGVAFVAPHPDAWTAAKKFPPGHGPAAAAGPERWLVAASRIGGPEEKSWRRAVVKEVAGFTGQNAYIYRPAVAALGLLQGVAWMPGVAQKMP